MTPNRLVLVGSVLVDLVSRLPALPVRGGDVVAEPGPSGAGGGFTVLSAAARLGLPAVYAGAHGTGLLGSAVREALAADGVELALPIAPAGDTGYCVVLVEPDGERTFVTVPGVEAALDDADLVAVDPRPGDAVYVSGYDLAYEVNGPLLGRWCARLPDGPQLVLDPGPLVADIPAGRLRGVLDRADMLTLNAREDALAGSVRATRPGAVTVLRDGPRAARVLDEYGRVLAEDVPPLVDVVDTTGAGDVHTGALLAARHAGLGWPDALRQADAAGALSVTRLGPGRGPTRARLAAATQA